MPAKKSSDYFIGRPLEFKALNRLLRLRGASLVVLTGRRRIGKSRLIAEFGKDKKYYSFTGLAPYPGSTSQTQRDEFARQLYQQFNLPKLKADDWGELFSLLAAHTKHGRVVILLDEISWMADEDLGFLSKLKTIWDQQFKKNSKLILVLCGSVSAWIEKNLLGSTGFLGRPALHMTLQELPLFDCNQFWQSYASDLSNYEKFKLLSVLGGVPRYLELIDPKQTAEENIRQLCFTPNSPLFDEFKYVFSDIYGKRSDMYQKIVIALASGQANQDEISAKVGIPQTGDLSEYLADLVLGGFVARDYTWDVKTGVISKLSHFRLKDNYTRFYLKYIAPHKERITKGLFENRSLTTLPGWDTILGLQFENLVLSNHHSIMKQLGIKPEDVVFANPFFQRKTSRQPGCQIDYMIQTRHDCVYICEIKFSRFEIKLDVIDEVKEKLARLKLPKHLSRRAVLIHVNGVREDVVDSLFFSEIIDFGTLLNA